MTEKPVFFRFQGDLHKPLIIQEKRAENRGKLCQLFGVQNRRGLSVGYNDRKGMLFRIGLKNARFPLPQDPDLMQASPSPILQTKNLTAIFSGKAHHD